MKITVNPDPEIVAIAKQQLAENGHQCPCVLPPFQNADTHCMCKEFREQIERGESGYCPCQYYYVNNTK